MKRVVLVLYALIAFGLAGCSTFYYDSAPASDGGLYVAGARQSAFSPPRAVLWHCPSTPGHGSCKEIEISE